MEFLFSNYFLCFCFKYSLLLCIVSCAEIGFSYQDVNDTTDAYVLCLSNP